VKSYRKRPIVIQAEQWEPGVNDRIIEETGMVNRGERETAVRTETGDHTVPAGCGLILTLEGPHIARPGDWIIVGIKGECYPCKPDIFEATYEQV